MTRLILRKKSRLNWTKLTKNMNRNNIIIGVAIFSAVLGLAVVGYLRATSGLQSQREVRPKIEITPPSFDFGEVEFGKIAQTSFKIKNDGEAGLEIKKVATSCGCTTAKVAKNHLDPGEETELAVSYNPAAMGNNPHSKGKQERIIYVKSNDPSTPQVEVTINAYVK